MSHLHHLSRGQLDKNKIQFLKYVLDKMIKCAPLHIRLPIQIIEFTLLMYCLIRFQKFISNLDEREIKVLFCLLENSKFQGFQMISKLQKSATCLVTHD